jgi:hypothetical protein
MEAEEIFNFLKTVFKEIGTMQFISQLKCDNYLRLRAIALDLNRANILSIAIYTDLMVGGDLSQFLV